MQIPYNKKLTRRAAELRKVATPQENKLWYRFLSKYPVRFKRQKPIDSFIVDFYCDTARLIIELDGSRHFTEEGLCYDDARTRILEHYGLYVLRFSNASIDNDFENVCSQIDKIVKQRLDN